MKRPLAEMEIVFNALADATRLRILGLLLIGEVCVCHIHDALRIAQPKASRHLAYLRRAGLVSARRAGTWMHYRLSTISDPGLATIEQTVMHALEHHRVVRQDLARLETLTGCCIPPRNEPARSRSAPMAVAKHPD
ncbi:MAG: ArsR/SmtB family transcription factor [Vicinamibacterales bacterium]